MVLNVVGCCWIEHQTCCMEFEVRQTFYQTPCNISFVLVFDVRCLIRLAGQSNMLDARMDDFINHNRLSGCCFTAMFEAVWPPKNLFDDPTMLDRPTMLHGVGSPNISRLAGPLCLFQLLCCMLDFILLSFPLFSAYACACVVVKTRLKGKGFAFKIVRFLGLLASS